MIGGGGGVCDDDDDDDDDMYCTICCNLFINYFFHGLLVSFNRGWLIDDAEDVVEDKIY
jgi:hypothetical protein